MVRIIKKSLSEVVTVIYDVPLRGYSFYLFQTGLLAKEKLMNSAQKLFAKVYEQAQAAQGAAGAQGQAGPQAGQSASQAGYGDDVVDGDYKEV